MRRREETCCFTGHRPEKLPWGYDESDERCVRLKRRLRDAVESAYEAGKRHFICGMARGCDFYFAEAVLELRRGHPDITLEAAIPCAGQSSRWRAVEQLSPMCVVLFKRTIFPPCCCSVTKLCPTLCDPMDCSTPASLSFTISRSLLKFTSIESVMPCNHHIL